MIRKLLPILLILLLVACQDDEENSLQSSCVVEGWIEDGGFPIVKLTQSMPVYTDRRRTSLNSLDQYVIKWARVTISDGSQTVTLTGKMDGDYFPPYVYTTTSLRGKAGRTYTLTVYRDDEPPIIAQTTIPEKKGTLIDSLTFEPVSTSDTLFQVFAHVTIQPQPVTYYRIFVNTDLNSSQDFLPSLLGVMRSDMISNGRISVNQGRANIRLAENIEDIGKNYDYVPYFTHGDTVMVRFSQIDSTAYAYWRNYEDILSLSTMPLFPTTTNMPMQIPNIYGFWQGWQSEYRLIALPKKP